MQIFVSGLQVNALAASFDFQWPSQVAGLLEVQQSVANIGNSLLSVDCFLDNKTTCVGLTRIVCNDA